MMNFINQKVVDWLGYWIIYLTLGGLLVMAFRGHLFAAVLLGFTYLAFSLPIGTSFWQGSRLHYPAEMAWSIVIAYLLVESGCLVKYASGRLRRRSGLAA
ncbi:MAG: hypothetical protein P1R58_08960 [bacterium]|nr:hypothetical protein [bacterium]